MSIKSTLVSKLSTVSLSLFKTFQVQEKIEILFKNKKLQVEFISLTSNNSDTFSLSAANNLELIMSSVVDPSHY